MEKLDQSLLLQEFCADSETSAPFKQFTQKDVHDRQYLERLRRLLPLVHDLKSNRITAICRCTPMTTVVHQRGLLSVVNGGSLGSLCCDHYRGKLRFSVHRYWRMRFCSAACMNAYQQRLSTQTLQKIYEIDGYRSSWKAAS